MGVYSGWRWGTGQWLGWPLEDRCVHTINWQMVTGAHSNDQSNQHGSATLAHSILSFTYRMRDVYSVWEMRKQTRRWQENRFTWRKSSYVVCAHGVEDRDPFFPRNVWLFLVMVYKLNTYLSLWLENGGNITKVACFERRLLDFMHVFYTIYISVQFKSWYCVANEGM